MPRTWDSTAEALLAKLSESGMSYHQLSKATGVPRPSLIRFMNGNTGLQGVTIDKLMAYFGLVVVEQPAKTPKRKAKVKGRWNVASISRGKNGRRTIQFVGPDAKRRSIRLGKVSQRVGEAVKVKVEDLATNAITGHPPSDETARWLAGLGEDLARKLAKVGLVPERQTAALGGIFGWVYR
jgi:transcriptional regulator with XRE-family HTH domain